MDSSAFALSNSLSLCFVDGVTIPICAEEGNTELEKQRKEIDTETFLPKADVCNIAF
ncbi:MAG: hypothetical protein IJN86_04940 [Clostridia bacterium]|nr:hypothetical protein [Clostridia bacterium]